MNELYKGIYKIRQYIRVSAKKQNQLIELVIIWEWKIKKAAAYLSIKYATAKNIIRRYRKTKILKKTSSTICKKRCLYKSIEKLSSPVKVVCTKGGLPLLQKVLE